MEARVEVHQLGDDLPDASGAAHPLGVLVLDQCAVRDVEPDHRRVEPFAEDALRRLRVGPDVELGRRRPVALADRAAHQHDPLGARVGMRREQQTDVRQRPGRDEDRLVARLRYCSREELDRVLVLRALDGCGRSGPSRPDSPCTCAATSRCLTNGASAPA